MDSNLKNSIGHGSETLPIHSLKFDPKVRPIWEIAAEISSQIPDSEWAKVPTDLSKNFDEYQTKPANEDSE
jgi:hypothetical protein